MKNTVRRNKKKLAACINVQGRFSNSSLIYIEKDTFCSLKKGGNFKSMGSIYDVRRNKSDMHNTILL